MTEAVVADRDAPVQPSPAPPLTERQQRRAFSILSHIGDMTPVEIILFVAKGIEQ